MFMYKLPQTTLNIPTRFEYIRGFVQNRARKALSGVCPAMVRVMHRYACTRALNGKQKAVLLYLSPVCLMQTGDVLSRHRCQT
jgi:hypothetical protein